MNDDDFWSVDNKTEKCRCAEGIHDGGPRDDCDCNCHNSEELYEEEDEYQ